MSEPQDKPPVETGAEPLARPKSTLWQRLGGEGLALSVILHCLLVLIAVIWVVSTVTDLSGKKDPNTFATGAGGGSGDVRVDVADGDRDPFRQARPGGGLGGQSARPRAECADLNGAALPSTERYNLVVPRSACPKCGHRITALENIPIASYIALGGKCSQCAAPISRRYPVVEALSGALSGVRWSSP